MARSRSTPKAPAARKSDAAGQAATEAKAAAAAPQSQDAATAPAVADTQGARPGQDSGVRAEADASAPGGGAPGAAPNDDPRQQHLEPPADLAAGGGSGVDLDALIAVLVGAAEEFALAMMAATEAALDGPSGTARKVLDVLADVSRRLDGQRLNVAALEIQAREDSPGDPAPVLESQAAETAFQDARFGFGLDDLDEIGEDEARALADVSPEAWAALPAGFRDELVVMTRHGVERMLQLQQAVAEHARAFVAQDDLTPLVVRSRDGKPFRRAGLEFGDAYRTVMATPEQARRIRADRGLQIKADS